MVDAINNKVMNVHDMRQFPTDLHISPVLNDEGNTGFTAFEEAFYTDDGESFDSTDFTKGTVNGYQFYVEGTSGARFDIEINMSTKATTKLDKTTSCYATSMNDYLGNIYVHNAKKNNIQSDKLIAIISFNNGDKDQQVANKDLKYFGTGNEKEALMIPKQMKMDKDGKATTMPICLSTIKTITVLEGFFPPSEDEVEVATELFE